jgi:hypothetical protein
VQPELWPDEWIVAEKPGLVAKTVVAGGKVANVEDTHNPYDKQLASCLMSHLTDS